jgi:hypothetical protein
VVAGVFDFEFCDFEFCGTAAAESPAARQSERRKIENLEEPGIDIEPLDSGYP